MKGKTNDMITTNSVITCNYYLTLTIHRILNNFDDQLISAHKKENIAQVRCLPVFIVKLTSNDCDVFLLIPDMPVDN